MSVRKDLLIKAFIELNPSFKGLLDEHIDLCDNLLPFVFFEDVIAFSLKNFSEFSSTLLQMIHLFEEYFDDESCQELIVVCFMEVIHYHKYEEWIVSNFGPKLHTYWDSYFK